MQTIKIKSIYPITFTREIEKELDLDTFQLELEDYLKDLYDNEISKKTLERSIKSLCWDIKGIYNEEIYSLDDDLNLVDEFATEVKVLNTDELIEYFSYFKHNKFYYSSCVEFKYWPSSFPTISTGI